MAEQYFGKYKGVVQDNRDQARLGRLSVLVETIFGDEVVLARSALPYGVFFVPEVGAKVWVEFEGGDSTLPIWAGVRYDDEDPGDVLPETQVNQPQKRVIKTGGNLIILNDNAQVAQLNPQDLEDNMNVIELGNARISIRSKGAIEIDAPTIIIKGRIVAPQPRPI